MGPYEFLALFFIGGIVYFILRPRIGRFPFYKNKQSGKSIELPSQELTIVEIDYNSIYPYTKEVDSRTLDNVIIDINKSLRDKADLWTLINADMMTGDTTSIAGNSIFTGIERITNNFSGHSANYLVIYQFDISIQDDVDVVVIYNTKLIEKYKKSLSKEGFDIVYQAIMKNIGSQIRLTYFNIIETPGIVSKDIIISDFGYYIKKSLLKLGYGEFIYSSNDIDHNKLNDMFGDKWKEVANQYATSEIFNLLHWNGIAPVNPDIDFMSTYVSDIMDRFSMEYDTNSLMMHIVGLKSILRLSHVISSSFQVESVTNNDITIKAKKIKITPIKEDINAVSDKQYSKDTK